MALPDDSLVYPAHGAGSLCGKALGKETFSTIGEQRRSNYALQPMSKETFIELVTADQPDAPAYFNYDAVLNAREHPTLDESLAAGLKPMQAGAGARSAAGGRADPGYARAGRIRRRASDRQPEHRTRRSVRDLGGDSSQPPAADRDRRGRRSRAGVGHAAGPHWPGSRGWLSAGWLAQPGVAARVDGRDRATEPGRRRRTAGVHDPPQIVDVRTPHEYAAKHIDGSVEHTAQSSRGADRTSCPPIGRCWCTARAGTGRRLRRACCSSAGLPVSANSRVASPRGKRRDFRSLPPRQNASAGPTVQQPFIAKSPRARSARS